MTFRGSADRRVLVVEDDFFIADELADALAAWGAEVVGPVASVSEALALLSRTAHLDGAILDIELRGETVYPVAEQLALRGVPFVFMTGYDTMTLPEPFGDVRYFVKPADPVALAAALLG